MRVRSEVVMDNGSKTPKAGSQHDRQDREEQESPDWAARILVEAAREEAEGEGLHYEEAQAMTKRHRMHRAKGKVDNPIIVDFGKAFRSALKSASKSAGMGRKG